MWLIWTLAFLCAYLLGSTAISLANNYAAARKTGLPVVISPVSRLNPLWLVLQRRLAPWMKRNLPPTLSSWTRHNVLSWFFDDKYLLFSELGSRSWVHVTPRELEFHCADPAVNAQVFARRADFDKPTDVLHLVDIYGPSISSVTGAEWRRHRRITASPFNERNNRRVWDEALRQAGQVAACWSGRGAAGFNTTASDTVAVSLNILATAALGESWDFRPVNNAEEATRGRGDGDGDGQAAGYRESLHVLLGSVRTLVVTPKWVYRLPGWCIPSRYLSRFVKTRRVFGRHMEDMVRLRKADIASGNTRTDDSTFLSALVLKSEEVRREEEGGGKGGAGGSGRASLSNDELYGNLFTYNLAGHETTANSLSFAIYLLAAFPEWQEWVREEVDAAYKVSEDGQVNTTYEDVFPNLKRCRAFLFETLRFYAPVLSINKATVGPRGQELMIDGRSVLLPPGMTVAPNVIASHTMPEVWGEDHMVFRPGRWIGQSGDAASEVLLDLPESVREKTMSSDGKGITYFPWSSGGRVCPGKKFSQVEVLAVVSSLLRDYRIEVVPEGLETEEQARKRCLEVIEDSETQITLQMRRPDTVWLRAVKRS
ncbi:putative cytochrome p450 [Diaporthe ampelina]|uniref:Putative cytochrome p450 n=1 Tax=Diaporthe ampelina TaxID=1214573 RepID=A0A0G2HGI7_9PEZI|nr:putative cytochrome p450 [Diaporthe ampelina]